MALTEIKSEGIKDGEIKNADINASAAIAGSKITPTFTASISTTAQNPNIRFDDSDTNNNGEITLDNTALRIEADEDDAIGSSKISLRVDGSERAKVDSADFTITDGDLVIGATGHGINFAASQTNAAGMTSELLDSYEEGLYTATLTCLTSGTITVNSSYDQLYYTKIGRVVYVTGRIRVSAVSSPNGAQLRLNLPFTSASTSGAEEAERVTGWVQVQGATKDVQDYTSQPTSGNNTYIQIGFADSNLFTGDVCGDISTSTKISVNFHYVT